MKLFGSITELVATVFRKNSQQVTLRPNQATTYTASRDVQLPAQDTDAILVSRTSTDTLTGKTIDGDDNTVQDLPVTAIKTVLGDANKVLVRDASGVPTSALLVNANVASGAAIDASKIADGTVSSAEFQFINTLSSNAQTQIDGKEPTITVLPLTKGGTGINASSNTDLFNQIDPLTSKGDITVHNGTNTVRLGVGTDGFALVADSAQTTGLKYSLLATDPTTTRGDLIRRGASALERFSAVTNNRVVRGNGTDVVLGQIDSANFFTTGAEVTASLPGVVKAAGQLLGTATNDNAAAGYVGEYQSFGGNSPSLVSGDFSDFASFTLTAGDWDLEMHGYFTNSSGFTAGQIGITSTAGNSGTGLIDGQNQMEFAVTTTRFPICIPKYRITVAPGTSTYYFKLNASFVAGTGTFRGMASARRVR